MGCVVGRAGVALALFVLVGVGCTTQSPSSRPSSNERRDLFPPSDGTPPEAVATSVEMTNLVARDRITLRFLGDIMLDRNVAKRSRDAHDPSYPFRNLPDGWSNETDLAIANLEGPLTAMRRPPEKAIDFAFDPSLVNVLKERGIVFVSQANNHALDQGAQGYADSIATLRANGIVPFGHQVRDDAGVAYTTTTIKGVTIALVGFNTTDNPLDKTDAEKTLIQARAEAMNVIVMMHWGSEYHATPDASVVETAHWLIDHGATAIIGGHPHWAQGIEVYHDAPIVYSLGNFIFDQDFSEETKQGMAVDIVLSSVVSTPIPTSTGVIASEAKQSEPVSLRGTKQSPISLRLHPIRIVASQPSLDPASAERLTEIAKRSQSELAEQIKTGVITLP